jgi:hypothetical protein
MTRGIERPVVAVLHTRAGALLEDCPYMGLASSWTGAIRLVRAAGYRVPSSRTRGWLWELMPGDIAETGDDAYGVPAWRRAGR